MPRQSRSSGRSAPPPARKAAPAPAPAQRAAPPAHQQQHNSGVPAPAPQQSSGGPGIMGSIAANAASVAIGSTMARGLTSALGWGGSSAPADPQTVQDPAVSSPYAGDFQQQQQTQGGASCAKFTEQLSECLSNHDGDMNVCKWYLDQFKACKAAAAPY